MFRQAGPPEAWSWPVFFVAPGSVLAMLVAIGLDRPDELAAALEALEPFRGGHIVSGGVSYCGPTELTLGLGALAQGRLDAAVADSDTAARMSDRSGASACLAEALHHQATALAARAGPGDRERARQLAAESDRLVRALGMTAFTAASAALLRRLGPGDGGLSAREVEVAALVADGPEQPGDRRPPGDLRVAAPRSAALTPEARRCGHRCSSSARCAASHDQPRRRHRPRNCVARQLSRHRADGCPPYCPDGRTQLCIVPIGTPP